MHFTKSLIFAAALGASSVVGRATHRHRHAELHEEKRTAGEVETADATVEIRAAASGVYKSTPPKTSVAAAAVASPSASASASSTSSGSSSSKSLKTYQAFCAASSKKRATDAQITYKGNTGSTWGCNMQLVDASIADKYTYTVKVTGQNTEPWYVVCWNKIGPDGLLTGWYNGNKAVDFTLQPGGLQYIAFDANSQFSCSAAPGTSIPTDKYGGYGGTWFEGDFGNESNNHWSGADISSIQAEAGGLKVYGMQAKYNGKTSTIGENLSVVDNAFDEAKKYADGIGFNIPAGSVAMELVIDWKS